MITSKLHIFIFLSLSVSNLTVSSMIYIYSSRARGDKHTRPQMVKWSPVTMQGETKPGRSAYMIEFLMHCNVDATKFKAELCLHNNNNNSIIYSRRR